MAKGTDSTRLCRTFSHQHLCQDWPCEQAGMPEQRSALWSNPAWPNFDRLWLKEETPSRKDGICEEEETDFHWTYVHLLSEAGSHIPL